MFYLNQFLSSIKRSGFLGLLFIFATALVVTISFKQEQVKRSVGKFYKVNSKPYFSALLNKELNLSSLERKIQNLPGVEGIEVISRVDPKKELGSLYKELDNSIISSLKNLNYSSFKIILSKNIKIKNQNLVREYMTRLVGKDSITLSEVKKPSGSTVKTSFLHKNLSQWSHYYLLGISFVFWLSIFILFANKNNSYFYLLTKFQRKKHIQLKSLGIGFVFILVISSFANFYFGELSVSAYNFFPLLLMGITLYIYSRSNLGFKN